MSATTSRVFDQYRGSPAEIYEQHFVPAIGEPFATPVVDAVGLRPGERVLDVACGTGVVARRAAERVGATGAVSGLDGNPGMLAVARTTAPGNGSSAQAIDWQEGSADDLPFSDGEFDAVLCSLGLQFFADKSGAVAEMRRVASPGGRVAVGLPGSMPPLFAELHDVLDEHLGADIAAFVDAVFSLDDPAAARALMDGAGLSEIDTVSRPMTLHLPSPVHFFWQYMLGTPLALAARGLDPDQRSDLEADVVARWSPFADDGGMEVDIDLILGTAFRTQSR